MLALGTLLVAGVCGGSLYTGLQKYRSQRSKRHSFLVDASNRGILSMTAPDSVTRDASIIGLTSATSLVHVQLGLTGGPLLQVLNGVGYAGLLAGIYVFPQLEAGHEIRDTLMAYTGITFAAYFLIWGTAGLTFPVGIVTKIIEALLIAALWLDRKARPGDLEAVLVK